MSWFRQKIIPTIFTVIAFIILISLGTWQVQRLQWKNKIIAEINAQISKPITLMPYGKIDIEAYKYQRVAVSGHFLHDKEIYLFTGPLMMNGEAGYNIFTPLAREDGSAVLVDRGWVPVNLKEQNMRPETLIPGTVKITGIVMEGEAKKLFTPDNDILKNLWFWVDIPGIAGFTGKTFDNVYVRAIEEDGAASTIPIAGKASINIRNDHLQYSIIWYSLALILMVVYVVYIKGQGKNI